MTSIAGDFTVVSAKEDFVEEAIASIPRVQISGDGLV